MTVADEAIAATRVRLPIAGALVGAGLIVALDQLTKWWALNALDDGRTIDILWTLRFALAFNEGMAFSQGTGLGRFIALIAVVVVVALIRSLRTNADTRARIATTLIIGGAVGNVVDRIFRGSSWLDGAVVDFIDLQWWPVFNIADMGIVCGAIVLGYTVIRPMRAPEYPRG
jgi:signal peptidase II